MYDLANTGKRFKLLKILSLFSRGWSYQKIADEIGMSKGFVFDALQEVNKQAAEDLKTMLVTQVPLNVSEQLTTFRALKARLDRIIETSKDERVVCHAIQLSRQLTLDTGLLLSDSQRIAQAISKAVAKRKRSINNPDDYSDDLTTPATTTLTDVNNDTDLIPAIPATDDDLTTPPADASVSERITDETNDLTTTNDLHDNHNDNDDSSSDEYEYNAIINDKDEQTTNDDYTNATAAITQTNNPAIYRPADNPGRHALRQDSSMHKHEGSDS